MINFNTAGNFNFGNVSTEQQERKPGTRLSKNKIHTVVLQQAIVKEIKTKMGEKQNILAVIFEGVDDEAGKIYEDSTFALDDKSFTRTQSKFGDNPSRWEVINMKLAMFTSVMCPKVWAKIQSGEVKLPTNSWDEYIAAWAKIFTKGYEGQQMKLKLVSKDGFATSPAYFVNLAKVKSGDSIVEMPVITNKWLGTMDENISYTTKEQETIDAEANARPTSASELNKVATEGFNLDMDLDKAHEEISKDDILDLGL